MVKKLYAIYPIGFLVFSFQAFAQNTEFYRNLPITSYYFPNKVRAENGLLYISVLTGFSKPQPVKLIDGNTDLALSKDATVMLDCKNKTFAISDYSFYSLGNQKGNVVTWHSEEPRSLEWKSIRGNDEMKALLNKVISYCL